MHPLTNTGEDILKTKFASLLVIATIAILPLVHAAPSGLTYLDSTWSSTEGEGGELIALNPNGTILASYHGKDIIFYNTTTLEQISKITFDEDLAAMEFNPNGTLLAINKRSTVSLKESIKLIDVINMRILESSVLVDDRFEDISWSIDGKILASQGNDGDVEQYHIPSLNLKNSLTQIHVVDVTCIDYRSDGQYILTGDESGRWAVWNLQAELQSSYKTFSEGLIDCHFSPDGNDIVLLGDNGKLTSRIFGAGEKFSDNVSGGKDIMFSSVSNRMHISVDSDDFRGLLSYDYNSFTELTKTTFFHNVEDVAFTEKNNGRINSLFVAGGTGEIAVYLRELVPEGFNQPGVDLDGDLVPDDIDPDDDGDGIIDDWDDDIGCDAPEGVPCSQWPDLSKIRNIEIYVGQDFVVSDKLTLPTEDSSHIRNLSRSAVAKDNSISFNEVNLFRDAICQNMDHDDIIEKWRESILLSNGELGEGVVTCSVIDGMELVRDGDSTTQITILITTTFSYSSQVNLPLEISLTEQPLPTDGSIAWLAPAHPVYLKFGGDGVEENEIPLWWNDEDNIATVTINQVSVKNPGFIEKLVEWAIHPLAFILYTFMVISLATVVVRRSNRIDFELDEINELDDDIETKSDDPDEDNEQDIGDEYYDDIEQEDHDDEVVVTEEDNEIPENSNPRPRKMYTTTGQKSPLVKKKRIHSSNLNRDGPITKTKRKRLVASPEPVEYSSPKIKTRKVKMAKKEPEIKKRKPVKRKSKNKIDKISKDPEKSTSNSEKKLIDEDLLQENLMNEFVDKD